MTDGLDALDQADEVVTALLAGDDALADDLVAGLDDPRAVLFAACCQTAMLVVAVADRTPVSATELWANACLRSKARRSSGEEEDPE